MQVGVGEFVSMKGFPLFLSCSSIFSAQFLDLHLLGLGVHGPVLSDGVKVCEVRFPRSMSALTGDLETCTCKHFPGVNKCVVLENMFALEVSPVAGLFIFHCVNLMRMMVVGGCVTSCIQENNE